MVLKEGKEESFTIPTKDTVKWYKVTTTKPDETIKLNIRGYGKFEDSIYYNLYDEKTLMDGKNQSIGYKYWFYSASTDNFKISKAGNYYIKVQGGVNENPLYSTSNCRFLSCLKTLNYRRICCIIMDMITIRVESTKLVKV